MTQLGYCCINMYLREMSITVNRSCKKNTFEKKGIEYVSKLALQNIRDLIEIINWNDRNDFKVYRMSSDMFPWMSNYELNDLPDFRKISMLLRGVGMLAQKYNQRLSFHPNWFVVLGSPVESAVIKSIKEINQHAEIMDLMGLPQSRHYPINIHCNGTYGNKHATLERWCANYLRTSESAQKRLVIENDDKPHMYSVRDLYDGVFSQVYVPITFDYHHHRFQSGGLSEREAFELAMSTWQYYNIKPLFHYSSCRRTFEDPKCKAQAHSDMIYEKINDYGYSVDIDVEAKAKELAILKYRENHTTLLENYLSFDMKNAII